MARTTKSAEQPDNHVPTQLDTNVSPPPHNDGLSVPRKGAKKRKHSEVADTGRKKKKVDSGEEENPDTEEVEDRVATDATEVKTEGVDGEEAETQKDSSEVPEDQEVFKDAGEMKLYEDEARKILAILERVDPLKYISSPLAGKTTLRSILSQSISQSPEAPTLRQIHSCISVIPPPPPRSRVPVDPSSPMSKPRFFEFARGLFDDVTERRGMSLKRHEIPTSNVKKEESSQPRKAIRYALVQHLPTGDYFTSPSNKALTSEELASISKGQASLLAVLPAPSIPPSALPTLGSYIRSSNNSSKSAYKSYSYAYHRYREWGSGSNRLSLGATFLDYGAYASFAPTVDTEGGNGGVGRSVLADLKARKKAPRLDRSRKSPRVVSMDVEMEAPPPRKASSSSSSFAPDLPDSSSQSPLSFSPEEIEAMEESLEALELENQVTELLDRNARAMQRLQEMQRKRLLKMKISSSSRSDSKGKGKVDEIPKEERELAEAIQANLATLTTLRPRAVASSSQTKSSLLPSTSTLHALQTMLPLQAQPGWKGTLVPGRSIALIDNTTVSPGPIPVPPALPPPPPPAARNSTPIPAVKKQPLPPPPSTFPRAAPAGYTPTYATQQPNYTNTQPRAQAPQAQQQHSQQSQVQAQPGAQFSMYNHYASLGGTPQPQGGPQQQAHPQTQQPGQQQATPATQYSAYPYYPNHYGYNAYSNYPNYAAWGQQQGQAGQTQPSSQPPRAVPNLAKAAPGTPGTPTPGTTLPAHLRKSVAPTTYGTPTPAVSGMGTINGFYTPPAAAAAPVADGQVNRWGQK